MKINNAQGKALCDEVIASLVAWPDLWAALQSGGLEESARGCIGAGIHNWLNKLGEPASKLLVVPEHKHIDFALVDPASVGQPRLDVVTILEVKFNYASQIKVITNRLPEAACQAKTYSEKVGMNGNNAYVLYFVASPSSALIPTKKEDRDSAWQHWTNRPAMDKALDTIASAAQLHSNSIINLARSTQSEEKPPGLSCTLEVQLFAAREP